MTPSAPVLLPDLAGAAAIEVAGFRDAALAVAAALPDRWIVVGVGTADAVVGPRSRGSFAGYGADLSVALSPAATSEIAALPLCALFAGWLRGQANPRASAEVRVYASNHDAAAALAHGRALRAEIDEAEAAIGVLVVADGSNTLTQAAPGGYDPGAEQVQATLDDALGAGDSAALARLPAGIGGRVAYQVLAGLTEPGPAGATELIRGAPYGVGYFVGSWIP